MRGRDQSARSVVQISRSPNPVLRIIASPLNPSDAHRRSAVERRDHRPASAPQTRLYTNPTDPAYNSDFQTVEFAINRRFANRWMLLTSFGYTWLDQFHAAVTGTDALDALSTAKVYNWRDNQRLFGDEGKETSTLWNYKLIGRYTMPYEIGFSASWKLQSGRQWGRTTSVSFPGDRRVLLRCETCGHRWSELERLPPELGDQIRR